MPVTANVSFCEMKHFYSIIFFFLLAAAVRGQWTKIANIPAPFHIVALNVHNSSMYAVSDSNIIFKSSDGINWDRIVVGAASNRLAALSFFNNTMHVARLQFGTLFSNDDGVTWQNNAPAIFPVSSFAVKNSLLFAATFGQGVEVLNPDTEQWMPFNNSLPDYSANVQNIISAPNFLLIGAGSNGTFYRYNFTNNEWNEEYYFGRLRPGLQINRLINRGDTLWAVNGDFILRSDDAGITWFFDQAGTHPGISRFIYAAATDYYTLTNIDGGGTWVQHRSKAAAAGDSWATDEELFPTGFSYDIIQFNDKLYLARQDGLFVKSAAGALPLHFTAFNVRCAGSDVVLSWNAVQLDETILFEVQKSIDGTNFNTLSTIAASSREAYSFTDKNAGQNSWYRIAALQHDGSWQFTDVLRSTCSIAGTTFNAGPNPTTRNFYINITAAAPSQAVVRVYDSKGAMIKQQRENITQGVNRLTIDLGTFANGVYNVSVIMNNEQRLVQVVKQ